MSIKRIKPIVWIIIVIAICVVLYIIVFHVPRPIILSSETLDHHGGGSIKSYDEDDNLIFSLDYSSGEIPVRAGNGDYIAVIKNDTLDEILRSTNSFRELNSPDLYFIDDIIYQIDTTTSKGPFLLRIGYEKSFWYRSGDTVFRYVIPDGQTLYDHITAALSDENLPQSKSCVQNDFEMILYTDKAVYTTTDIVQVWATLEYIGKEDAITIWSGDPFMVFSFTDGKGFNNLGTPGIDVLKSTILGKGEIYIFNYQKSVVVYEDSPDADFWREFAKDPELRLPAGTYTISLKGDFGLTENVMEHPSGLLCELIIEVVE